MFIFYWDAFPKYNKSKPAKYGLLFPSINSTELPYTYSSAVYAREPTRETGEHHLLTTDNVAMYLVTNLGSNINIEGRNISCDRYYTSLDIANWLLEKNMTIVGTSGKRNAGALDHQSHFRCKQK